MKQKTLFNLLWLLLVVIILIIVLRKCSGCSGGKQTTDTVSVRVDTVYVESKKDTTYIPQLIQTIEYVPQWRTDTLETFETITVKEKVDTQKILRDYYATKVYSDTQTIQYGKIIINDRVSQNKITRRRLIVDQKIPEITKTVTLREPRRNIVYVSLVTQYTTPENLFGVGGGLMFQFKNKMALEGQYLINSKNSESYQVGLKIPIRLKK